MKLRVLAVVALVPVIGPTSASWACGRCGCPSVHHHVVRHHVVAAPAHVEVYHHSSYSLAYYVPSPPLAYPVYYAPPVYAAPTWYFGFRPYGWGYHPYWGGYGRFGGYYRGFHGGWGRWGR